MGKTEHHPELFLWAGGLSASSTDADMQLMYHFLNMPDVNLLFSKMSNEWIGGGEWEGLGILSVYAQCIPSLQAGYTGRQVIRVSTSALNHKKEIPFFAATKELGCKMTGSNPVNRIYGEGTCGKGVEMYHPSPNKATSETKTNRNWVFILIENAEVVETKGIILLEFILAKLCGVWETKRISPPQTNGEQHLSWREQHKQSSGPYIMAY